MRERPVSRVITSMKRSCCESRIDSARRTISARPAKPSASQAGCARRAAATRSRTSSAVWHSISPIALRVPGLSRRRRLREPLLPATGSTIAMHAPRREMRQPSTRSSRVKRVSLDANRREATLLRARQDQLDRLVHVRADVALTEDARGPRDQRSEPNLLQQRRERELVLVDLALVLAHHRTDDRVHAALVGRNVGRNLGLT